MRSSVEGLTDAELSEFAAWRWSSSRLELK
jgi:hypothetical protein